MLRHGLNRRLVSACLAVTLAVGALPARAEAELVLLIQPILSEERTRQVFQPLADYIGAAAGKPCRIQTLPNFLAYWDVVRRGNYDFAFDAAHFTDYRVQKMGFSVLAKIPDGVSYSLIVPDSQLIFDPLELAGKRVATLGPPSIGAARLNAMYPNPVRQPVSVEVGDSEAGIALLRQGKVGGAILPTPFVSQQMARGDIAVVLTTEPIPHIALSASGRVPRPLQESIRTVLVQAERSEAGKAMLTAIGFERFDPATPDIYANQRNMLSGYWGY